jgi:hypothetical protein
MLPLLVCGPKVFANPGKRTTTAPTPKISLMPAPDTAAVTYPKVCR